MPEIHFTYLNGPDMARLALTDDEILGAVENVLKAQGEGETRIEPRVHIVPEDSSHGHFNVLRGYIRPLAVAGVKIVGDFVNNYQRGLPSEMAVLNLFDPETGVIKAVVDATSITDMRTGAMTAIGAKHLARKNSRVLGHVGSRGTAYWNVRLLDHLFDFEEIRVHSRRPESREAFGRRLEQDLRKPVTITDNWRDCVEGADIVVEAARLPEPQPLLKTAWIKRTALVVPYGTMSAVEVRSDRHHGQDRGGRLGAVPQGVALRFPEAPRGRGQAHTRRPLYGELGEIVAGRKPGRENDGETILFWHRGLSTTDMALGCAMLAKAERLGVGQRLRYA